VVGVGRSAKRGEATRGIALPLARGAALVACVALYALFVVSVPARLQRLQMLCGATALCAPGQRTIGVEGSTGASLGVRGYAAWVIGLEVVFATVYVLIALSIFLRRIREPMALFVAFMLVAWGTTFPPTLVALQDANPRWFLVVAAARFTGAAAITLFFFIFPDGRFQPPWAAWLSAVWIASQIPKYFAPGSLLNPDNWPPILLAAASGGFLAVMMALQGYRYRWASDSAQRRQTKWVVLGIACALSIYAALLLLEALDARAVRTGTIGYLLFLAAEYACILLIPLSLAVAILRDRLYDVDQLINRTLVYGSLTATLTALYFGVVIGLQTVVSSLSRQASHSPLIIVASTLAIAGLFEPLRGRIQHGINRRFFRSRYDAAKTLAEFGQALRDEVDLDELTEHLLAVVEHAMGPSHVSLWLTPIQDGDENAEPS
jgi:hypothetical protein